MEEQDDSININFKAFFQILWKEKLIILLVTALFTTGGIYYAFTAREEFISEGKILPEVFGKGSSMGGLSGLAALAGVNLGDMSSSDAIRPDLYPEVLKSTPFFLELLKMKVNNKEGKLIPFEEYYKTTFKDDLEGIKENAYKVKSEGEPYVVLTKQQAFIIKDLRKRIIATSDKKTGIMSFSVKFPDPVVAANVATLSMAYLTDYVTTYRTQKVKKDLNFLEDRLAEAKGKYFSTQERKAQYSDQYQLPNIRLKAADIQRERIESQYSISQAMYNELVRQYEQAKIKVQQETPVFKVLEPASVPVKRSEPQRVVIVLVVGLIGCILSIFAALIINNYKIVL